MIKLPDSNNYLLVGATYISESPKAIQISYEGNYHWFPKSQVEYDNIGYEHGEDINIEVPQWLLEEKGII